MASTFVKLGDRLAVKLTAAFIVVALIAVGLVSYLANRVTADEFATYLNASAAVPPPMVQNAVLRAFEQSGSWTGTQPFLQQIGEMLGARLIVSDVRGRVVADTANQAIGRTVSREDLAAWQPLSASAGVVGFLSYLESGAERQERVRAGGMMGAMMGGMMGGQATSLPQEALGPPEKDFLAVVNDSLWAAALVAAVLAAVLGLLLVRQITSPLRALSFAAQKIATGDLAQRVPVRSHDEFGEVAKAFNAMADTLARNEQFRRQLVADIAHELRTPLAVIQGNLEGMRDGVVEATADRLASVHEECLLLARLIDDLRELSLAEAGQLPLHQMEVDLGALVRRAVVKIEGSARGSRPPTVLKISDPLPLVSADPDRVEQVLHNLLSNALRHTPADGNITVAVSVCPTAGRDELGGYRPVAPGAGDWVAVSVTDTGGGIPPADLPHVFDRFYRVDKSRSRVSGGSGIGLAVVKQLVEAQGGRVWAKSETGRGSEFSFALPAIQTAAVRST